jgi:hypothetical protein
VRWNNLSRGPSSNKRRVRPVHGLSPSIVHRFLELLDLTTVFQVSLAKEIEKDKGGDVPMRSLPGRETHLWAFVGSPMRIGF